MAASIIVMAASKNWVFFPCDVDQFNIGDAFELVQSESTDTSRRTSIFTVTPCDFQEEDLGFGKSKLEPSEGTRAHKKKQGRRTKSATRILSALTRGSGKPLKLEDFRCKVIKEIMKFARLFKSHREGDRKSNRLFRSKKLVNKRDHQNPHYRAMKGVYEAFPHTFDALASTKAEKLKESVGVKTFNNAFCRDFFKSPEVREFYHSYVQHLFDSPGTDPNHLCREFNVKCCVTGTHTDACKSAWEAVKKYALRMIDEPGPWPGPRVPRCEECGENTSIQVMDDSAEDNTMNEDPDYYLALSQ